MERDASETTDKPAENDQGGKTPAIDPDPASEERGDEESATSPRDSRDARAGTR